MRRASAQDHWRRVQQRWNSFRIGRIRLDGIRGVGAPATDIPTGQLIAICGHNGSGKTTLLRCIEACLLGDAGHELVPELGQDSVGRIRICVEDRGDEHEVSLDIPSRERIGPAFDAVYYFQPSAETPNLVRRLRDHPGLDEVLQQYESREADAQLYSYLVGKTYDKIIIYEIELGDDTVPYFTVESHGARYGSEAMGLGEFSMFYLLWWLEGVPRECLVLIEEPEAFISPRSQAAVADVLAKFTDEKRLFTLTTTHSPMILNAIPRECIRVLVREGPECVLVTPTEQDEHLAVLGVESTCLGIVFVEDICAQYLLETVLIRFAPGLLRTFSIVRGGSWQGVINTLKGIPVDGHPKSFFGVLDADQRQADFECKWPILFLPGEGAPDFQLRAAVVSRQERFAECLNRDAATIRLIIANLDGTDAHDWPHEFSRRIGIDVRTIYRAMAGVWVEDRRWADDAQELAQAIRARV